MDPQRIILGMSLGMIAAAGVRGVVEQVDNPDVRPFLIWSEAGKQALTGIVAGVLLYMLTFAGPEMARIAALISILILIGFLLRDGGALFDTLRRLT